jgi:hypothetical protein
MNLHSFLLMLRPSGVLFRKDPYGGGQISHHFVQHMWKIECRSVMGSKNCPVSDKRLSEETGQASSRVFQTFWRTSFRFGAYFHIPFPATQIHWYQPYLFLDIVSKLLTHVSAVSLSKCHLLSRFCSSHFPWFVLLLLFSFHFIFYCFILLFLFLHILLTFLCYILRIHYPPQSYFSSFLLAL